MLDKKIKKDTLQTVNANIPKQISPTLPSWVKDFFDDHYAHNLEWDETKKQKVPSTILDMTGLKANSLIFDQCCGTGDLSIELAKKGFKCLGVDQNKAYIQRAIEKTDLLDESLHKPSFVCVDAGSFIAKEKVDLALNWHTSIGYGGERGAGILLKNLHLSVKSGGYYILEIRHVENYKKSPVIFTQERQTASGVVTLKRVGYWKGLVLYQKWESFNESGELIWSQPFTSCFHPDLDFIYNQVEEMGDKIIRVCDDNLLQITPDTQRMIVLVKKCK